MKKQSILGKTVVITGASSGAGWAMALEMARQGGRLVLAARRMEALETLAKDCREMGAEVWVVKVDTREATSVIALATAAVEYTGALDVWINNAGILAAGQLEDIPAEVNESVIRTNLLGYIQGARAVMPYFKAQGYGWLINNISIGAWLPTPYMAAYSASKFGLEGFTEALRGELRHHPDIHVCNLYPGFLDTPGIQHAGNYTGHELRPSPPLTDPLQVAKAAVKLIAHPRNTTTVGFFPHLMKWAYRTAPELVVNSTANVMSTYLRQAAPTAPTSGNTLDPVAYGTGIHGGWMKTGLKPGKGLVMAGLAAIVVAVGFLGKK